MYQIHNDRLSEGMLVESARKFEYFARMSARNCSEEQEIAVEQLLLGNDVLAALPTGYGTSMIYTLYLLARQEMLDRMNKTNSECIIVISPLTSIIADQIAEMGFKAVELCKQNLKDVLVDSQPQFIYCSAENVICPTFIRALQNQLHESVAAIVVDESHTET